MPKAKKVVINAPIQRKEPFEPWEIRRIKYEYLVSKIVSEGDAVFIDAGDLLSSEKIGEVVKCVVIETDPKGEVQITPKTEIIIKYKPL